jgi:hypothetical protein
MDCDGIIIVILLTLPIINLTTLTPLIVFRSQQKTLETNIYSSITPAYTAAQQTS